MSKKLYFMRTAASIAVVVIAATGPATLASSTPSHPLASSRTLTARITSPGTTTPAILAASPFSASPRTHPLPLTRTSDESDAPAPVGTLIPDKSAGICPTTVAFEAPKLKIERLDANALQAQGIAADGNVYSWRPILPSETLESADDPALVEAPEDDPFVDLAVGPTHTVALTSDGVVYTWGDGAFGALGNNSTTSSTSAVDVEFPQVDDDFFDVPEFTQVAAGTSFSFAINSEGELYAWGANDSGQLGDATFTERSKPVRAQTPIGVTFVQMSAGTRHSIALGSDGNAYAWGSNKFGQLGNGSYSFSAVPALVSAPDGVTFIHVDAVENLSAAIGSDGAAYVWGSGDLSLGENLTESNLPIKVQPPDGVTFKEISISPSHALAVATNGAVYAWGLNGHGKIGAGHDFGPRTLTPVKVLSPDETIFAHVTAGNEYSLALTPEGYVYAWGKPYWLWGDLTSGYTDAQQFGVPRQEDPAQITSVTFGGTPGTDITRVLYGPWSGSYQVTSPAHAPGTVDFTVAWDLGGDRQEPITYSQAFSFNETITLTDPDDQTTRVDKRVFFGVDASVCEDQPATWEFSDDGETWEPIEDDTITRVSVDFARTDPVGLWVRPRDTSYDGRLYRVTVANEKESVTSKAAILTVVANDGTDNKLPISFIAVGVVGVAAMGCGIWWFVARRRR